MNGALYYEFSNCFLPLVEMQLTCLVLDHKGKTLSFTIKYNVNCDFPVDSLYQIESLFFRHKLILILNFISYWFLKLALSISWIFQKLDSMIQCSNNDLLILETLKEL